MIPEHSMKDLKVLCQVLRQLNRFSSGLWRERVDMQGGRLVPSARSNYDRLSRTNFPRKDKDFDDIETEAFRLGTIAEGQFYMPPLEGNKDFIPLLWVECDFSRAPPNVAFRVGMYRFLNDGRLQVFGFRFEMHNGLSNHDYYHVQVTPTPHNQIKCEHANWIPAEIPCVMLPAKNPVSLIFCMLISFYGRRISEKMITPMNLDREYLAPLEFLPRKV